MGIAPPNFRQQRRRLKGCKPTAQREPSCGSRKDAPPLWSKRRLQLGFSQEVVEERLSCAHQHA